MKDSELFIVDQSTHKESEYENYIYTHVHPKIYKPSLGRRFLRKTREIYKKSAESVAKSVVGRALKKSARSIVYGVAIAVAAVAGAHLVGLHLAGLHTARALHVLFEVAYGAGAVALGTWLHQKAVAQDKKREKEIIALREKRTNEETLAVQDSGSDSSSSRGFTFKSFFLGIKARLNSSAITTTVSNQNTFKK